MVQNNITHTFNKGDKIYTLLYSMNNPDIFMPVQGIVLDYKWDENNPQYQIKIKKFYDSMDFLNKYIWDLRFFIHFDAKFPRTITQDRNAKKYSTKFLKNTEELINLLEERKFYTVVDSVMCCKHKVEFEEVFNKLQYVIISNLLKSLKSHITRRSYKDFLKINGSEEFNIRLQKFMGDKFDDLNKQSLKTKISFDIFTKRLY